MCEAHDSHSRRASRSYLPEALWKVRVLDLLRGKQTRLLRKPRVHSRFVPIALAWIPAGLGPASRSAARALASRTWSPEILILTRAEQRPPIKERRPKKRASRNA
jgi:hypothetical protein